MDMREARRIFFDYDGYYFHMDRELPRHQMESIRANVTPEIRAAWMEELTERALRTLTEEGNSRSIYVFNYHSLYGHLESIMKSELHGSWWQRCAFLEDLLRYVDGCKKGGCDASLIDTALRKVVLEADRIRRRVRAKDSVERVEKVLADAKGRLDRG